MAAKKKAAVLAGSARERLLALAAPKVREVDIEGQPFYVRSLSSAQRGEVSKSMSAAIAGTGDATQDYVLVWMGLCEADGASAFDSPEDAAHEVAVLDGAIVNKLAREILEISGLTAEALEKARKKS